VRVSPRALSWRALWRDAFVPVPVTYDHRGRAVREGPARCGAPIVLPAALLDVDGTLVDTNYQHAIAWYRAFRKHDIVLPVWRIHRHIGMGGDHMVEALAGQEAEERIGDEIRAAEKDLYSELIDEIEPMPGARRLIIELRERGHEVVLASSAKAEELDHYLDMLDAREIADAWTSSADVDSTKPDPDLVNTAMDKTTSDRAVMIGDSTWDCEAALRAGVDTVALLTGGFSDKELMEAGAVSVYESLSDLREHLDETPLARSD
jgi:HAD superfamily hydrolase (TIGR01509 family)